MLRAETLQLGSQFANFKHRLENSIFKSISWLNSSFYGVDDRGFSKEGVKAYQMAPMSSLNSSTISLPSQL
jgi:hypothetical protein